MVSLSQGNSLRKSAFSSKIIVKDYVVAAYLSDRLFLAIGHIFIRDFLQRFLAKQPPKKYPFNIRLNSDDPMIRVLRVLRG